MKVLYKIVLISGVILTLLSCKQKARKDASSVVETEDTEIKEVSQKKSQTIEEFLQQLQTAVKNNDIPEIENKLKFPFEFKSGGESFFYDNYKELKEDGSDEEFSKIIYARIMTDEETKFLDKEKKTSILIFDDNKSDDYFIMYHITEEKEQYKLVLYEEPH